MTLNQGSEVGRKTCFAEIQSQVYDCSNRVGTNYSFVLLDLLCHLKKKLGQGDLPSKSYEFPKTPTAFETVRPYVSDYDPESGVTDPESGKFVLRGSSPSV